MATALISKLKTEKPLSLATMAFYGLAGLILLIMLPLSGFPPHIGLLGIVSLVTAYGLLTKRFWTSWLIVALFFVVTASAIFTLYYIIGTDAIASAGMIAYLVLTWFFTVYAMSNRKTD